MLFRSADAHHSSSRITERAAYVEEDEDIFAASMSDERQLNAKRVGARLVGGDTASFRPLVIDEDIEPNEIEGLASEVESDTESDGEDPSV